MPTSMITAFPKEPVEGKTPIEFISVRHNTSTNQCAIVEREYQRSPNGTELLSITVEMSGIKATIAAKDLPPYIQVFDCPDSQAMTLIRDILDKADKRAGRPPLDSILFGAVMKHPLNRDVSFIGYTPWRKLSHMDTSNVIRRKEAATV